MKILVVEDDLTLSAGICFELDCSGYLTIPAYNCKKAIHLIQNDPIDLVILDVTCLTSLRETWIPRPVTTWLRCSI